MNVRQDDEDDDKPTLGVLESDGVGAMQLTPQADGLPGLNPVIEHRSLPVMSEVTSPCMRGPCVHYMRVASYMEHGNSGDAFEEGKDPRYFQHFCDAIAGSSMDFTSETYPTECNRWDPMHPGKSQAREQRRELYLEQHPALRPLGPTDLDAIHADDPPAEETNDDAERDAGDPAHR